MQNKINKIIKAETPLLLRNEDKKPIYPMLNFTTSDKEGYSKFPTVYIHFLPSTELNPTLDRKGANGFNCGIQIEVYTVDGLTDYGAEGDANTVMYAVLEVLKRLSFEINSTPEFMNTNNNTTRLVARATRPIGYNDNISYSA